MVKIQTKTKTVVGVGLIVLSVGTIGFASAMYYYGGRLVQPYYSTSGGSIVSGSCYSKCLNECSSKTPTPSPTPTPTPTPTPIPSPSPSPSPVLTPSPTPEPEPPASSGKPDLKLSNFSGIGSAYEAGMYLDPSVTITNQGNASTAVANACANKQIAVKAYQAGNLKDAWYISDLAAGQTINHTFNVLADEACSIHNYCTFTAKVDADNCVTESDEGNNIGGRGSLRAR